jgi:hypothetical protein
MNYYSRISIPRSAIAGFCPKIYFVRYWCEERTNFLSEGIIDYALRAVKKIIAFQMDIGI